MCLDFQMSVFLVSPVNLSTCLIARIRSQTVLLWDGKLLIPDLADESPIGAEEKNHGSSVITRMGNIPKKNMESHHFSWMNQCLFSEKGSIIKCLWWCPWKCRIPLRWPICTPNETGGWGENPSPQNEFISYKKCGKSFVKEQVIEITINLSFLNWGPTKILHHHKENLGLLGSTCGPRSMPKPLAWWPIGRQNQWVPGEVGETCGWTYHIYENS